MTTKNTQRAREAADKLFPEDQALARKAEVVISEAMAFETCDQLRELFHVVESKQELKNMTEPELKEMMTCIARTIEALLPKGPSNQGKALFTLLVTAENDSIVQYVANCDRNGSIGMMRTGARQLERREDVER